MNCGRLEGPCAAARAEARRGLYVHVPFCAVRCRYCDFSTGSLSSDRLGRYLGMLEREMSRRAPAARGRPFSSVFFGGGTPSALPARHFTRLWRMIADHFEIEPGAEITLEANPESVRAPLLEAWAAAGVNRLSMGAQSFEPAELERLGRIHGADRPAQAFALARAHGFRRLSLDLMFGFPGHGASAWERTLEAALTLEPEHVSAYCFIPEEGTALGAEVLHGVAALPSGEAQADLYARLEVRLAQAGMECYETSNFCRPDAEARHNLVYWLRRDYLGLGPSAHGLWQGIRYGNLFGFEGWAEALERDRACDDSEPETEASRADEIVMLALRLAAGLDPADYPPIRWSAVWHRYGRAFRLAEETGRLERAGRNWRIPRRHRFVADDVIAWLMAMAEAPRFDSARNRSVPSQTCHTQPFPAA